MSKKIREDLQDTFDQLLKLIQETPETFLLEWAKESPDGMKYIQDAFLEYGIEISYNDAVHFWYYASLNWSAQWLYVPENPEYAETHIYEICEALKSGFSPILD